VGDGVFQAAEGVGIDQIAGRADDEEIAQVLVKDDLRGDA
jgi:hypothetical protein